MQQMSQSSSNGRQHSLTRFHKPTLDPTPTRNDPPVDCEDVHLAPTSPYDKEPMFEKPLTPSDVGKLNRLVIPKQYAEKYFPIGAGGGDSAGTLLLRFEDEAGKRWRFRYSYWNSSQSYVLTKGWSRYVKEKCLDAGDVVVFERHRSQPDRFFVAWRRRGAPQQSCYNAQGSLLAQDSRREAGPTYQFAQADRRRLSESAAGVNSTRLVRLFGVNLECEALSIDQSYTETTSSQSSSSHQQQHPIFQTQQQGQEGYYRDYVNYMGHPPPTKHLHHHYNHNMEMEFTEGGMKQMGSDLGL